MTFRIACVCLLLPARLVLAGTFTVGPVIPVAGAPARALITPNGAEVYVTNTGNNTVSVINTATNTVTATLSVSGTPSSLAVAPDGSKVYVGNTSGSVSIITVSSKAVTTIPTAGPVRELTITPNGSKVYLALEFSGLWQLVTATNNLSQVSPTACAEGVAVTPNGATLYVNYQCSGPGGSPGHDAIGVFNANTNAFQVSITGQPNVGGNTSMSPNGTQFWEAGGDACSSPAYDHVGCPSNPGVPEAVVNIIGTSSNTLVRSIGGVGGYMSFTPDSSRVFLAIGNTLELVDTTSFAVVETIAIPGSGSVVFTPDGTHAYAPLPSQNGVAVLSTPQLTITGPASLPSGMVNQAYPVTTMTATGGTGPYTWSATSGIGGGFGVGLPDGLTLNVATGVISGTPTSLASGVWDVSVKVKDATSATAFKEYTLTITGGTLMIGPILLPPGTVNQPYSATVFAKGGTEVYTWSATGLPPNLSIAPGTGVISGTPTTSVGSPFNVTVKVTDSASATASMSYALTINPAIGAGVLLTMGNGSAGPGQSVEVPMQLTTQTGNRPAGFQADASFDQQKLSYVSSRIGEQLTNAGKTLSSQVEPNNDVRFLGIGFNQNMIANGNVAYVTFKLSSQFTAGTTTAVTLKNCQSTDMNSMPLQTACGAGIITAGCTCDANGDGSTNVSDAQFLINQVLIGAPSVCHSGGVNVSDVQRVINAVLGLGCN